MKTLTLASAALAALPLLAGAATTPDKAQLVRNALTAADRISALDNKDFVFDFKDPSLKTVSGAGGKLVSANVGNFAALVGAGLALTVGTMQPCGINSPHTHPRATEILLLLNGTISSGFLQENGSRFVVNNVTELSAMVFPAGSIHFQANYGCHPVQFVAALSDEDPGTLQVAQRFFALSADVVGSALGGLGVQQVNDIAAKIPDNMIAGTKECYQRCGIPYPTDQPTKQQQPPSTSTQTIGTTTYATTTIGSAPSAPTTSSPKVIDVIVGKDQGLTYQPDDITAAIGDTVRFHFVAKNHTLTQSSFGKPCTKLDTGFDSGFVPIAANGPEVVYDIKITDNKPIWFYCQQRPAGAKSHCAQGMNGGINAPKDGDHSVAKFKEAAAALP